VFRHKEGILVDILKFREHYLNTGWKNLPWWCYSVQREIFMVS